VLPLVRDLLREDVNHQEDGDADDGHEDQGEPSDAIGYGIERLAMEERSVGLARRSKEQGRAEGRGGAKESSGEWWGWLHDWTGGWKLAASGEGA
jgi:hypothetical protein